MRFGAHYLFTYVPDLDGPAAEFYRRMFQQVEELDKLGFDHIWVTELHFNDYGGMVSHPPTFLSAIARTTRQCAPIAQPYRGGRVLRDGGCGLERPVGVRSRERVRTHRVQALGNSPGGGDRADEGRNGDYPAGLVRQASQFPRGVLSVRQCPRASEAGPAAASADLGRLRPQRGLLSLGGGKRL
ncbi:MAG: LLM class flavin-dependent oxidoreductase [Deltaproteobacteria bacterium]|nr:MAG: LLM class flavin-dependent oxidoreductase [Deltaproteobacteria bacterium]